MGNIPHKKSCASKFYFFDFNAKYEELKRMKKTKQKQVHVRPMLSARGSIVNVAHPTSAFVYLCVAMAHATNNFAHRQSPASKYGSGVTCMYVSCICNVFTSHVVSGVC